MPGISQSLRSRIDASRLNPLSRFSTPGAGTPNHVVLAHGFGQNRRCWGRFATELGSHDQTVLVDLPGHGASSDVRLSFPDTARELAALARGGVLIGYSLGARLALAAGVSGGPTRLVLISGSPGLADPAARTARRAADESLAQRLDSAADGAVPPSFIADWLAQPLFAGLDETTRFEAERSANSAAGLAWSLREQGTGAQPSLWHELAHLDLPVLVIVGTLDAKFVAIGEEMTRALPQAELVHIAGAGHSPHLERPAATLAAVRRFLSERGEGPRRSRDGR
jgi:2-succinyl-6-hydroxy-2,4-cyclohexadiene-1-carboxylate synthase